MYRKLGQHAAREFLKIGTYPGLKQYRRVMQGLEEGLRSMKGRSSATEGFALHGTHELPGILEDGRITASRLGETGQHGAGVYWWKGFPREEYLTGAESEGILSSLTTLPEKKPMMRNIYSGHANPQAVRTGPGDYKLRRGDTAVIDLQYNDPSLVALAQERGLRVVDSNLFNQALRDFKAKNMIASGRKPPSPPATDAEIIALHKKRTKPKSR